MEILKHMHQEHKAKKIKDIKNKFTHHICSNKRKTRFFIKDSDSKMAWCFVPSSVSFFKA